MPMKKPFSLFHKITKRFPGTGSKAAALSGQSLWLWLLVHLAIPLLFLLSVFLDGPVRINTMLFDMLPRSGQSRTVMEADKILGEKNSRELVILAAAGDFQNAKKGAAQLCTEFEHSPDFEKTLLYFDSALISEFRQYLFNYRFVIAGRETLTKLESGGAGEIAEDALASAFGAFNFIPMDNIEKDPFLLTERRTEEFLSSSLPAGGGLSPKENVLSAEKDGTWYVLLRMTLAPGVVSVGGGKNAVGNIYTKAAQIKESIPGLEFYFSGIPFHSYESSSGARREISIISTVTLVIILVMFIFVFRSPLPVIFSVLAAVVSLSIAAATALLVFREIHIITFVFGTTLIGTSVDYSVHFFVHWKGNRALKSGLEIRSHILKSITMCVISTELAFFVFLLAPFPILKQFAVFSIAGLLSSFLTAFCLYPRLKIPEEGKRKFQLFRRGFFLPAGNPRRSGTAHNIYGAASRPGRRFLPWAARLALVIGLAISALTLLFFNSSEIKIDNKLSSLYTMSAALLESEKRTALVLDYGSPGWYFIIEGGNSEETLEREERLTARLEEEIRQGNLGSFLGTSVFVPSIKTQTRTYEAMKALLPLLPSQFESLGFPPEYTEYFYNEFPAEARYCLPEDILRLSDTPFLAGISNLWTGDLGGSCYSCVLPLHPVGDESLFRTIAGEFGNVHFVNKAKDISGDLDTLTRTMLLLFLAAYLLISIVICLVYPWRDSLKICAAPLFLVLAAMAALALNGIPMGFFPAAALVLVFGLGLDYIFYMTGKKHTDDYKLIRLAVTMSFLTTLLSFGALALSSFAPVHIFGLTVSSGLSAAFIFAMLLNGRETPGAGASSAAAGENQ